MVLGVSSAFALLDTLISLICDSEFGRRWNRSIIVTVVVVISFLISLIFCTEFGYYLLDGFDTWLNNFSLVWVVMCEFLGATMLYRYKDVVGLLGWNAYGVWTASYLLSLILGVPIGQSVHPGAGAGVGFGIFFVGLGIAVALAHTPQHTTIGPPRLFAGNAILQKLYYLLFYQVSESLPNPEHNPLTHHPGLPTVQRPQPDRRSRRQLENSHLLGPSAALHIRADPSHNPQLLVPVFQRLTP
jgi:solute carrier family 6 GABA transporter-like protein 1